MRSARRKLTRGDLSDAAIEAIKKELAGYLSVPASKPEWTMWAVVNGQKHLKVASALSDRELNGVRYYVLEGVVRT